MNLSNAVKTAKRVVTANSPVLLVGTAVAGVIATGVLAAKGGYKARGIIDEVESVEGVELDTVDKVKLTWLCYAAPAVTGISTIASVVGVHTIHTKRHAALTGLYVAASSKLDTYQAKAEEMLGAKKAQQLRDDMAQEAVDENPPVDHEIYMLEGDRSGGEIMYDDWGGRYFWGSMPIVDRAVAEFNLLLAQNGTADLNEFYDLLGLTPVTSGTRYGWDKDALELGRISVTYAGAQDKKGRSCIAVNFSAHPKDLVGIK